MNKTVLGTIIGTALLGLAKKGSKSNSIISLNDWLDDLGGIRWDFTFMFKPYTSVGENPTIYLDMNDALKTLLESLSESVVYNEEYIRSLTTIDDWSFFYDRFDVWHEEPGQSPEELIEYYLENQLDFLNDLGKGFIYSDTDFEPRLISHHFDFDEIKILNKILNVEGELIIDCWSDDKIENLAFENDVPEEYMDSIDGPFSTVSGYIAFSDTIDTLMFLSELDIDTNWAIEEVIKIIYDIYWAKEENENGTDGELQILEVRSNINKGVNNFESIRRR